MMVLKNTCFAGMMLVVAWLLASATRAELPTSDDFVALCKADDQAHSVKLLRNKLSEVKSDGGDEMIQAWLADTPLHVAAQNGCTEITKLLLEEFGADAAALDENNWAPLNYSALFGHVETAALLMDFGGSVSDNIFQQALESAVSYGRVEVIELLLERGANPNYQNEAGHMSLHHLCSHIGDGDWEGLSEVDQASQREVIFKLLLRYGADPDMVQASGMSLTPLHLAAHNGYTGIVQQLLAAGADSGIQASDGQTPLDIAVRRNHLDIVNLLGNQTSSIRAVHPGATASGLTLPGGFFFSHRKDAAL